MLSLLLAASASLNPIPHPPQHVGSGNIVTQSGALTSSGLIFPSFLIEAQEWWKDEGGTLEHALKSYEENGVAYEKIRKRASKRQDILRRTCRRDMRKANRDQTLPTALRCLRGELTLELSLLRKEKESLNMFPLPGERTKTIAALETLSEAIVTIVNAIDRKVYRSIDELLGTKEKLLESYRLPYQNAHKNLRNAHLLAASQILLAKVGKFLSESPQHPGAEQLLEGAMCLEAARTNPIDPLTSFPPCLTPFLKTE